MKSTITKALLGLALCSVLTGGYAQSFPSRPVHLVVPYPPGGGTDVVARILARALETELDRPVVIENKPGANESIGTGAVARATPDGHTIGLVTSTYSINWVQDTELPYGPESLVAVAPLVGVPMLALVPQGSSFKSMAQLIEASKRSPGGLNYASLGRTSLNAMSIEWLKHLSGADLTEVAYKGAAQSLVALSSGEVDFAMAGLGASRALLDAGKIRPLAISTRKAFPPMPTLPPVADAASTYDVQVWYGIVAPAGVPQSVLDHLNSALTKVIGKPETDKQLVDLGYVPMTMSQQAFKDFLVDDATQWREMAKAAGIKNDKGAKR